MGPKLDVRGPDKNCVVLPTFWAANPPQKGKADPVKSFLVQGACVGQ